MRYRVFDVETTGVDTSADAVVEIACVDVVDGEIATLQSHLVNPGRPIPPGAMAVHHITDDMVRLSPGLDSILSSYIDDHATPVAHNAAFDAAFLPRQPGPWLCTYRLAQHVWPDLESYGNQFLWYAMARPRCQEDPLSGLAIDPHRAMYDAMCTARVLIELLRDMPADADAIKLSQQPILQRAARFGKHRGQTWSEIPADYMRWCLTKMQDLDPDTRFTIQYHLKNRGTS